MLASFVYDVILEGGWLLVEKYVVFKHKKHEMNL